MKKTLAILATVVLAVLFVGVPAWADIVDPATLQIGDGGGGSNPTGELQNDPVYVGTTNFSIYQNSGGPALLDDPLVVILAVPDTGTLTGSISSATLYNPYSIYPGGGTSLTIAAGVDPNLDDALYGTVLTNTFGAFQGNMTSSGGDLYTFLGLGSFANNSFNWSNLTGATLPNGDPNPDAGVTSFNVYAYSLSDGGTNLDDKGLVDVFWSASGLPGGTFIAAYGVSTPDQGPDAMAYSTPFTRAGLTQVPEPSSLLLFGSGLLGLALLGRKRFAK